MDLSDLYKQVPLNARLFIDSLRGVTTPVTEKDLSSDELKVLEDIYKKRQRQYENETRMVNKSDKFTDIDKAFYTQSAEQRRTQPQVSYSDYSFAPDRHGWLGALMETMSNPAYRIGTSLGNFGMKQQGNNLNFYDKYNWNGDFAYPIKSLGDLWNQTSIMRPTEILNGLAELYAPKVTRPVNINIPVPQMQKAPH